MATAISCPNCDCKMSVRSELAGQRVTCPHCKSPFLAPAENGAGGRAGAASQSGGSDQGGMDFLSDLSSSPPRPSASRPAGKTVGNSRGKTAGNSWAKTAGSSRGKPAGGGLDKIKKLPMEWIVAGGVGAALLLIILLVVVFMSGSSHGGKHSNVKYGLSEPQRKKLYYDLLDAVNNYGVSDEGRKAWRSIEKRYGVGRDVVAKVLDEGMSAGGPGSLNTWPQPQFPAGNDAGRFAKFKEWVRQRGLNGENDPLLRD